MYNLARLTLIAAVLAGIYSLAILAAMLGIWSLVAVGVYLLWRARRRRPALTAHGTARVAGTADLRRAGMIDVPKGLILGRLLNPVPSFEAAVRTLFDPRVGARAACRQFLFNNGRPRRDGSDWVRLNAVHTVAFAPTGAGKGVSCIVPFLLSCPDSCVIVDFKGENAKLTARHRRRRFGHRVVVLDPFAVVTPRSDTLNPLDGILTGAPGWLDDIRSTATELVVRTTAEREPHWNDAAEMWTASMTACVARYAPPGARSLQDVRGLFEPKKMETAIQLLCASDDEFLARMGAQLTHFRERELSSALTTTSRHLRFLDTPAVAASTRSSSFNPTDLRRGRMTVYLVIPPEFMRSCMGLLRLWVGTLMRTVVRGGLQEAHKVHFVLDEAASLGTGMPALADAVDKYRAYGIRCQFYYQSMGQLKLCWPEDQGQTLLSNAAQVFFGVNDMPTAEYVSARLGVGTTVVTGGGSNTGRSESTPTGYGPGQYTTGSSSGRNQNWSQIARKLLTPDEVLRQDPRTAMTFVPGIPPVMTRLVRYFEESALRRPPGLIRRGWAAVMMLARALAVLVGMLSFALMMTEEAADQMKQAARRPPLAPGPNTPRGPGFPAGAPGRPPAAPWSVPKGR